MALDTAVVFCFVFCISCLNPSTWFPSRVTRSLGEESEPIHLVSLTGYSELGGGV